jgi:hypothetical protein
LDFEKNPADPPVQIPPDPRATVTPIRARLQSPDLLRNTTPEAFVKAPLKTPSKMPAKKPVQMPLTARETARETARVLPSLERICLKCGFKNRFTSSASMRECKQCGVIFERYRPGDAERVADDIEMAGRHQLLALWKQVTDDYNDEAAHMRFIMACYDSSSLAFASYKYSQILEASPSEELARLMHKRIESLAWQKMENQDSNAAPLLPNVWLKLKISVLNQLLLVIGSMLLTIGLIMPQAKDLVLIGGIAMAVSFVLRLISGRT